MSINKKVNVVLFEPEIAQNVAAIIRTCVATNSVLHIIEPLGFIFKKEELNRASAGTFDLVDYKLYDDWNDFESQNKNINLYCISRYGKNTHSDYDFNENNEEVFVMFGKESTGIDKQILKENFDKTFRLPMTEQTRSINLANTVGIVVYEILRQWDYPGLSKTEVQKGADYIMNEEWRNEK
ncbi:RNA methyltransferase [Entomoplasma ellychniae]|uniref:Putative tRNA (cytidine(34)-2'-O)-methyltransferase n=1 Tax=Entomoplasma ellychniae TaxID=2114 RepID=A0A8E2QX38_9MOLU|nr:tRNA (cytidine(34)-2'-O)-methyltransferase [Entomoplasma ellychniae]PPE04513.1 RNA methyltransferase [Entomoplasma ellychniae]